MKLFLGITGLLATGLCLKFASANLPFFRGLLALHITLGLVVVPGTLVALYRRLKRSVPELTPPVAISVMVLLVLTFAFPHLKDQEVPTVGLIALLLALVLGSGVAIWRGMRGWFGRLVWSRRLLLEIAHALMWAVGGITGPLIVLSLGGRDAAVLFTVHSTAGIAMVLLGALLMRRILRDRWRAAPVRQRWAGTGAVAAVLALVAAAGWATQRDGVPIHLSPLPNSKRAPEQRDVPPLPLDRELLSVTRSCGGEGGCHAGVVSDHMRSPHALSNHTPHFNRSMELLAKEVGDEGAAACAGCHNPRGLAKADGVVDEFRHPDAFSCSFCHSVVDATPPDHGAPGSVSVALGRHLELFRDAQRENRMLTWWERLPIDLHPAAHGRALAPAALEQDALCLACHEQIRPAGTGQDCVQCHMSPRIDLRLAAEEEPEAQERNHLFPGSNVMLPTLLGDAAAAAIVDDWVSSRMLAEEFPVLPYLVDPTPSELGPERLRRFFYVDMGVDASSHVRPGGTWEVRVQTTNRQVEHGFPAGPMDLLEVWLEVRVRDAAGREVFRSGGLDERHRVLEDSHRLGGYTLDAEGNRIDRYRVWTQVEEVVERQIAHGESVEDVFEVPVPDAADARVLTLEARWRYRELNQAFVDWAYGPGRMTMPVVEIAETFAQATITPRERADPRPLRPRPGPRPGPGADAAPRAAATPAHRAGPASRSSAAPRARAAASPARRPAAAFPSR